MTIRLKELLELRIRGFKEALLFGVTEAEFLGKEFVGITLSNGDGVIIHLNPYTDEIYSIYYFTEKEFQGNMLGIFAYGGNTYKLYEIDLEFLNKLNNIEVVSVEVIKGVLEDFLTEAMAK